MSCIYYGFYYIIFQMEKQVASAIRWRKQGLKVQPLSPSAHHFRLELNASTDPRFRKHHTPETAQDFRLNKRHV